MKSSNGIKVIATSGLARSGKDTFCAIAKQILEKNGLVSKQYSLADQLKKEIAPFLKDVCEVDVWTQDVKIKNDIRDFLVWYGTTFWRKRDPKRWIRAVDVNLKNDGNSIDVALISDVRYPNEAEWVHAWGGDLIHISAYTMKERVPTSSFDDGPSPDEPLVKTFFEAPNSQEELNDPIVKSMSDYNLEWESKGLSAARATKNKELQTYVLKALNSCSCLLFSTPLSL